MSYLISESILQDSADNARVVGNTQNELSISDISGIVTANSPFTRTINTINNPTTIRTTADRGFFYNGSNIKHPIVSGYAKYILYTGGALTKNDMTNISPDTLKYIYLRPTTKITAGTVASSPFNGKSPVEIFTSAESKPDIWGTYFNYYAAGSQLTVHYGVSEDDFKALCT